MTDTEWLALLKRSPRKAHSVLIEQYGNLVYAIVINKLRSCAEREEIEDCVSDVFVKVFESAAKFDPEYGTLKSFISTIAKNTAIDGFRRLTCRRNVTSSIEDDGIILPPADDSPEEETQQKLFRRRLWEIVRSLGEPDTSIIVFQYFYDLTIREIAKKLSMSADAVQKRSLRARKRIGQILLDENYC